MLTMGLHMLAHQMIGVLCQKLVQNVHGKLFLLPEYIENGGAIRDWISKRSLANVNDYMNRGSDPNSRTFMHSAISAFQSGIISEAEAAASVGNEAEFRRAVRGIS